MRFKSFKIGKTGEDKEPEVKEKVTMGEVAEMEKKMADKTRKLKDTAQQIKDLSEISQTTDDDEDITGPHGPLIELTVEPGDELTDIDTEAELNSLMENDGDDEDEEIKVVEVIDKKVIKTSSKEEKEQKAEQARAEATEDEEKDEENKEEPVADLSTDSSDDSFSNLFSNDEDEVNPLANLINSLPEVSAQELITELEEIKGIIKEKRQG
jgi:hypothetical protein